MCLCTGTYRAGTITYAPQRGSIFPSWAVCAPYFGNTFLRKNGALVSRQGRLLWHGNVTMLCPNTLVMYLIGFPPPKQQYFTRAFCEGVCTSLMSGKESALHSRKNGNRVPSFKLSPTRDLLCPDRTTVRVGIGNHGIDSPSLSVFR